MTRNAFVYIWEYIVCDEHLEEFKKVYGPEGEWIRLFRKADGYITTHFHQDLSNPKRFITVDFWYRREDRDNFRKQFSREFEDLDKRCEQYTEQERLLGDFNSYISSFSEIKSK